MFRSFINYKKLSLITIVIHTNTKRTKELFLSLKEFFEKLTKSQLNNQDLSKFKKLYINYYKKYSFRK